jgi:hypothetical protein
MTAATICDVSALTERESVFWYLSGLIRSAVHSMAMWILLPPFLFGAAILAQFFPWRVLKVLRNVNARLPSVQDNEELTLIRDVLILLKKSGNLYRRLCLFRRKFDEACEEISETIDSLNLVIHHEAELTAFAKTSEARRTPDLPLGLERRATG